MAAKQSMTVSQVFNPKHNANEPKDDATNPIYIYQVVKSVNTLAEPINGYITPARVNDLIGKGVDVTIQQVK